jgi:serine/threonine kinase 38
MCAPVQEIKSHPFFDGINWDSLDSQLAPYMPRVDHELDTQNFERFDEDMNMTSPGAGGV